MIFRTLSLAAILLAACAAPPAREPAAQLVTTLEDLHAPESVRYDPEDDVFYVANMVLHGSVKDNNGIIMRVRAADLGGGRILAQGGVNGVTLHAPKGMAMRGDTLWVADIDVVRGFHRRTGAPLGTIDLTAHRPTLLNDVAVGEDGTMRVTDTGIVMSPIGTIFDAPGDRVFVLGSDGRVTSIPAGLPYAKPNGVAQDRAGRWLVVTFTPWESHLYALDSRGGRTVVARGKGKWDGVEALDDGRVLVTSWSDSSVHVIARGVDRQLIRGLANPADPGVDTRRNRIAIPLPFGDRVELWTIPPAPSER